MSVKDHLSAIEGSRSIYEDYLMAGRKNEEKLAAITEEIVGHLKELRELIIQGQRSGDRIIDYVARYGKFKEWSDFYAHVQSLRDFELRVSGSPNQPITYLIIMTKWVRNRDFTCDPVKVVAFILSGIVNRPELILDLDNGQISIPARDIFLSSMYGRSFRVRTDLFRHDRPNFYNAICRVSAGKVNHQMCVGADEIIEKLPQGSPLISYYSSLSPAE